MLDEIFESKLPAGWRKALCYKALEQFAKNGQNNDLHMSSPSVDENQHSEVEAPNEVADDIPVVAASMAAQRIDGEGLDSHFHNSRLAYQGARGLDATAAKSIRAVSRAAYIAKHGTNAGKARKHNGLAAAAAAAEQKAKVDDVAAKKACVEPSPGALVAMAPAGSVDMVDAIISQMKNVLTVQVAPLQSAVSDLSRDVGELKEKTALDIATLQQQVNKELALAQTQLRNATREASSEHED